MDSRRSRNARLATAGDSPEINSSATLVNSLLDGLLPVMLCSFTIFLSEFVCIGPEQSHWGVVNKVYIAYLNLHLN